MFCPECGTQIEMQEAKYCGNCGKKLDEFWTEIGLQACNEYEPHKQPITETDCIAKPNNLEMTGEASTQNELPSYNIIKYLTERVNDWLRSCSRRTRISFFIEVTLLVTAVVFLCIFIRSSRSISDSDTIDYVSPYEESSNQQIYWDSQEDVYYTDYDENNTFESQEQYLNDYDVIRQNSDNFHETYTPVNFTWLVEPKIEADHISMAVRTRPVIYNNNIDFNSIGKFMYDRASIIKKDNKYGLIAYNGLPLCDIYFDEIYVGYDYKFLLEKPSKDIYYTINSKYEQIRLIDDSDIYDISGTAPNEALYWVESETALYNDMGDRLIDYDIASAAHEIYSIDNGFYTDDSVPFVLVKNNDLIIDVSFDDAGCFCDGVIPVKLDGKWGYVDENGSIVLPFEFESVNICCGEEHANNVTDSMIVVKKDNEYALYDLLGHRLIDYGEFEEMSPVYEGMMWVKYKGKWGVISLRDGTHDIYPDTPTYSGTGYTAKVKSSDGLRLREKADTNSTVLGILSNHKEVVVLSSDDSWRFICVNDDVYGWVKKDYLT